MITPSQVVASPPALLIVSGLSGSGKSVVLRTLEDLDYYCVDNLPTPVAKETVEVCEAGGIRRIGLGIDVRVGSFLEGATAALEQLASGDREIIVMFLDATDEVLLHAGDRAVMDTERLQDGMDLHSPQGREIQQRRAYHRRYRRGFLVQPARSRHPGTP